MKNRYRFTRSPKTFRQSGMHLDNVALVPASLLRYKATWQKIANNLPRGDVLVVFPSPSTRQRRAYETAAQCLRALGKRVRTIGVDQLPCMKE